METLRDRRKALNLTLEAMAGKIGITASQLCRIEAGKPTSLKTAMAIEKLTGAKVGPLADLSDRDVKVIARVLGGEKAA